MMMNLVRRYGSFPRRDEIGKITGVGGAGNRGLNWEVLAQLWGVGFCAAT